MYHSRKVTRKTRLEIYERDKGICQLCGHPVGTQYDVDHIVPLWSNGTNLAENLQLSCRACHKEKTATESGQRSRRAGHDKPIERKFRGLEEKPRKKSKWPKRTIKSRNTLRRDKCSSS